MRGEGNLWERKRDNDVVLIRGNESLVIEMLRIISEREKERIRYKNKKMSIEIKH